MVLYQFKRDDGILVEKWYPIGECPKEIVCDDGRPARRVLFAPSVTWKGGYLPPSAAQARNTMMNRMQEDAARKSCDSWPSYKEEAEKARES